MDSIANEDNRVKNHKFEDTSIGIIKYEKQKGKRIK